MQINTLDKANIINELHVGVGISHAVQSGRRADFSLLLALFSDDVRDSIPTTALKEPSVTEATLRTRFGLPAPQSLTNDQSSYAVSAKHAELFQSGGLPSAKLSHYLMPEALSYRPEDTGNLPEETYHNLSAHQRRELVNSQGKTQLSHELYDQLTSARRQDQISFQA